MEKETALKILRERHDQALFSERTALETLIPELAENEDERIKKELLEYLKDFIPHNDLDLVRKSKVWIAWLEKQGEQTPVDKIQLGKKYKCIVSPRYSTFMTGKIYKPEDKFLCSLMNFCSNCFEPIEDGEQKPADKVEPKFHEGDWISGYYTNYKVLSVNNNGYVVEDVDGSKINILFENEKFHHLFTIADAKAGDVLTCNIGTFIYYKTCPDNIEAYIYYNPKNGSIMVENFFKVTLATDPHNCFVHPASKEQRDALFQKMKEEGYEWNAEKKELKKIGDWVDLGLPSGTLWKNTNETNPDSDLNLYTYDEAMQKFGDQLPTKKQLKELKDNCRWTWTGNGYNVTGPNGNSIFLPAAGSRNYNGNVYYVGTIGCYWLSKTHSSQCAWYLYFTSWEIGMDSYYRWSGQSVRLVNKL